MAWINGGLVSLAIDYLGVKLASPLFKTCFRQIIKLWPNRILINIWYFWIKLSMLLKTKRIIKEEDIKKK